MPIYKYVTEDRIDILSESCIRFTQPSVFNDPFEVFPHFVALTDDTNIKNLADKGWGEEFINKAIDEAYKKQIEKTPIIKSVPNFKQTLKALMLEAKPEAQALFGSFFKLGTPGNRQEILLSIRRALDNTVGILCLTERPDDILMWGHYSNGHRGFAIEFDEKNGFFDRRTKTGEIRRYLRKVNYSAQRPSLVLYNSNLSDSENLNIWINDFFWNKSICWQYERELRIFDTLKDCQKRIEIDGQSVFLFSLPLECIKGIIFGCSMSEKSKESLRALIRSDKKYSHIAIKNAVIDERKYQINIVE